MRRGRGGDQNAACLQQALTLLNERFMVRDPRLEVGDPRVDGADQLVVGDRWCRRGGLSLRR